MILERTPEPVAPEVSRSVTAEDRQVLPTVDEFLARGLDLKRWWTTARATQGFADKFELARSFHDPDEGYGFFGEAPVQGQTMPVMGNFQSMFYDQPKSPAIGERIAADWMRDQLREFILHYFMRVSSFYQPTPYVERGTPTPPLLLRPISWCPQETSSRLGFGFSQLFYKRKDSGEIGEFPDDQRFAIVDLREIGTTYEWIVTKVQIFGFSFTYRPFGASGPALVLPLEEFSYLVLSRDFILNQDDPAPGALGGYGFGYAFIKSPGTSLLAYGPGEFDAAIELIDFYVDDGGKVRVDMVFVANRPTGIINLPLNPLNWGVRMLDLMSFGVAGPMLAPLKASVDRFSPGDGVDPVYAFIDLVNLATGGYAARELCITRDQLDRDFLVTHFMQHYTMASGSLLTWRLIRNWLDAASLPRWVVRGEVS
jgi:hypothetical protein